MRVDGGVARRAREVLAVTVGDVLAGLGIAEPLGESKINNVYVMLLLANTNQEVVGLDITMQEMTRMNELNSLQLHRRVG